MMTIDAILLHRIPAVATYNIISNTIGLFQYFEYDVGGINRYHHYYCNPK